MTEYLGAGSREALGLASPVGRAIPLVFRTGSGFTKTGSSFGLLVGTLTGACKLVADTRAEPKGPEKRVVLQNHKTIQRFKKSFSNHENYWGFISHSKIQVKYEIEK